MPQRRPPAPDRPGEESHRLGDDLDRIGEVLVTGRPAGRGLRRYVCPWCRWRSHLNPVIEPIQCCPQCGGSYRTRPARHLAVVR